MYQEKETFLCKWCLSFGNFTWNWNIKVDAIFLIYFLISSFSSSSFSFSFSSDTIIKKFTKIYKKTNKWSTKIENIVNTDITSPKILKQAIEDNLTDEKKNISNYN